VVFNAHNGPINDLDADDSTHGGRDYRTTIAANGPTPVAISDSDIDISDPDDTEASEAQIQVKGAAPGDLLAVARRAAGGNRRVGPTTPRPAPSP
jgi:hypothetical protein